MRDAGISNNHIITTAMTVYIHLIEGVYGSSLQISHPFS